MIKLFRNIRRNLLVEGKTSKCLKYAIGEIVLVMMGVFPSKFKNLNVSFPSWEGLGVGNTMRKIIPYNPNLVALAKSLRNNMTLGEIALWREIKGKKLGVRFSRQIPIDQYIVDFYCKDLRLAIEVDGSIHFTEGQQEKDKYRQYRLESLGVHFNRFSDLDVKNNLCLVLEEIKIAIENCRPAPSSFMEGPTPSPSQEGKSH